MQETFKRALAARRKPIAASSDEIRPWAFTIMRHIWQNERRRQSHAHETSFEEEPPLQMADRSEQILSRELLFSEVRAAVDSLPSLWREIILMRDIEGLSYAQIAAALDCPIGTVMSRLARARAAVRQLLWPRTQETHRP